MVGHVTKDGSIAGPRVLEHVVDVVLHFEGDRNSRFRMVRALKNRFGPVDEVGCFDLGADGITAVTDPTGLFVENHERRVPGTCVAVTMEGRRPMLAEVQALVTTTRARAATTYDVRARLRPGGDGARRPPAALRHRAARPRRLRLDRRRRPADRAGQRPGRSRSRWRRPATGVARRRAAWSRWARSAWPERCARSATCRSGIAEAARLGFRVAVVPVGDRGDDAASSRTVDGMTVLEAADLPRRAARARRDRARPTPRRRRLTRPLRASAAPGRSCGHGRRRPTPGHRRRPADSRGADRRLRLPQRRRGVRAAGARRLGRLDVRAALRLAERLRLDPRAGAPARSGSRRSTSACRPTGATCPAR